MLNDDLRRVLDHAFWADEKVIDGIEGAASAPEALGLLAHVLATEAIYLLRINGSDPWPQDFWPDLSLAGCRQLLARNRTGYAELLQSPEAQLQATARYRSTAGTRFDSPRQEMILHVALHGMHHRGQAVRILRQLGQEPPVTDFIAFVREYPTPRFW